MDKLKEVHAVEFLGEPQYGGGRPVLDGGPTHCFPIATVGLQPP